VQVKSYLRRGRSEQAGAARLESLTCIFSAVFSGAGCVRRLARAVLAVDAVQGRHCEITALPTTAIGLSRFCVVFSGNLAVCHAHSCAWGDVVQFFTILIPVSHPHYMAAKRPPVFTNWLNHAWTYGHTFPLQFMYRRASWRRTRTNNNIGLNIV